MKNIHPEAIKNLQRQLVEILNVCEVKNGWPDIPSRSEGIERFIEQVLKHKKEWVAETNVYLIIIRIVAAAIAQVQEGIQQDINGSLKNVMPSDVISSLADRCLKYILSIPREYLIYFPLPSFKADCTTIELSSNVFLKMFLEGEPNVSTPRNLLAMQNFNIALFRPNQWYIAFKERGYCSGDTEDTSFVNASSRLKIVLYLGLLNKFFCEKDPKPWTTAFTHLGFDDVPESLMAISIDVENPLFKHAILLPRQMSKLLSRLCINTDDTNYLELFQTEGPDIREHVRKLLSIPVQLSSDAFSSDDITSIRTAVEWAFEAKTNENETVSFIQACIGLEAVLGEDTKNGLLSATLADRCAYLISPRIADRKKLREEFESIYHLRSKLVHGRRMRLSGDDKNALFRAKTLLNMVIKKEIRNVKFPKD